jgi:hypothetical protein
MKYLIGCFLLLAFAFPAEKVNSPSILYNTKDSTTNIFIITIDGYRWQELFNGADSAIVANPKYTADSETIENMYGGNTAQERRKKLMPFIWSVVSKKGQLYGNRYFDNNVNVSNPYAISYAGYSEMFTGSVDLTILNNNKNTNQHKNIFEYLNSKAAYKGSIALFTSWDVFPIYFK